eukprot:gene1349-1471_t
MDNHDIHIEPLVPRRPDRRVPWRIVWKKLPAYMVAHEFNLQHKGLNLAHVEFIPVQRDERYQDDEESLRRLNEFSRFVAAIRRSFSLSLKTAGAAAAILAELGDRRLELRKKCILGKYYAHDYFKNELFSWRFANLCLLNLVHESPLLAQLYAKKLFEAIDRRIPPLKLMDDHKHYFHSELNGEDVYKGKGILLAIYIRQLGEKEFSLRFPGLDNFYIRQLGEKEFSLRFPSLDKLKEFIPSGEKAIAHFQKLDLPTGGLDKAIEELNTDEQKKNTKWDELFFFVKYLDYAVQLVDKCNEVKTAVFYAATFLSNFLKCPRGSFASDVRLRVCFYHYLANVPYSGRKTKNTLGTEEQPRKKPRH